MKVSGTGVFTVHPRSSKIPLLADVVRRYGVLFVDELAIYLSVTIELTDCLSVDELASEQ
jgi:hypothetical protein